MAALLGGAAVHGQSLNPATFVALSSSVVRIEANGASGRLSIGSGITVAPAVVVTNCHVTREATAVRLSGSGRLWEVTDQVADTQHDLCFLRAPEWRGKSVVLGNSLMRRPGERVAALGFTGGTSVSLRFGRIVALHSFDVGNVIESNAAFTSGASGGGLFDAGGALIGLLTFRSRGSGGNYYALPAEWVRDRLPAESQWSELRPLAGARPFWQDDADALPYFMRSELLESEGRWSALLDLANHWSAASPHDAEPRVARGKALQNLQQPRAAAAAFQDALQLAPDDSAAWYGLAIAYSALGDKPALREAQAKLESLDDDLAAAFKRQVARSPGTD
jgi:hypothetical protein